MTATERGPDMLARIQWGEKRREGLAVRRPFVPKGNLKTASANFFVTFRLR